MKWFSFVLFYVLFAFFNLYVYAGEDLKPQILDGIKVKVIKRLKEEGIKKYDVSLLEGEIKAIYKKVKDIDKTINRVSKKFIEEYRQKNRLFNPERANILVALIVLGSVVLYFILAAIKGEELFVRPIAGLKAIDEAVGRATEMGKEVMFIPGIYDMDDLPTIAGISILSHIARKTAEYETDIKVPVAAPIVFSAAKEIIKEAHLKVGRPDTYNESCVRYIANDQFSYAAGVCGMMVREKPATIFYMGTFYAESLLLAETGHAVNAIQIAGTTQSSQLPFFVAACDYTIIGEELYAASAYFSRDPMQLGGLKGQDAGKLMVMVSLVIGVLFTSIANVTNIEWFNFFTDLFKVGD